MPPILFYGPFAPPANGQRIAHETFFRLLEPDTDLVHVPIDGLSVPSTGSVFSGGRLGGHARGQAALLAALRASPGATVYFCAAGSPRGLLRDVVMVARIRRLAGRIVAHVHSGNYEAHWKAPRRRPFATWLAGQVDAFAVPSKTQADRVRPVLGGTPVYTVTNVVHGDARIADDEMEAIWVERGGGRPLRVLYLSNFLPSKGYSDLLEAARHVTAPVEMTFAGSWSDPGSKRSFERQVRTSGVSGRVQLLPPVQSRAGVRALLAAHDVVALPSSYPSEAQPLSILEGMANGCVPVTTPHASMPEYVLPGVTGVLVPPGDPEALARGIDSLADPAVRLPMGRKARALADRSFVPEVALPALREALGICC